MRFWSEGLGDRELVMGLERAELERKGDLLSLTGVVDSPAPWEYEVKMSVDDWRAILQTAVRPDTCDYIARRFGFAAAVGVVLSIARFVVLLAAFRLARVLGLGRRAVVAAPAAEKPAAGH